MTQRNTLRRALAPVPRGRLSPPRRGGGRPATAPLRLAWPLCWCPWSAPGRLSGARGRAGGVVSRSRRSLRRGHPRRKLCRGVGGGGPSRSGGGGHPFHARWGVGCPVGPARACRPSRGWARWRASEGRARLSGARIPLFRGRPRRSLSPPGPRARREAPVRRARGASLEGSTGPPVSWAAMARVGRLTFTCAAGPSLGRRRTDAWLVCPAGARARVGAGDAPLGEKAFSSDPRGCLWGTAAPSRRPSSVRVVGHWVPLLRPVWLGGGPRATDALPGLPRPAPPPNASGEGHAGPPARVSRRAGWCAPRGEVEARGATRARPRPASDGLPLLLSAPSRLSLARSRPEPRPVGAARGHGSGRLARGWGRGKELVWVVHCIGRKNPAGGWVFPLSVSIISSSGLGSARLNSAHLLWPLRSLALISASAERKV